LKRAAWFVGLWIAGVSTLAIMVYAIRLVVQ
jgi:hypothetical protein